LRVPLRSVDGFAQTLESKYAQQLDREGFRMLARVRAGAAKVGQLLDDLLRLTEAGRRALRPERVEMSTLAHEAASEFVEQYPRAIVDIRTLPDAWADPSAMKAVWSQVIGNALKFSAHVAEPRIQVGAREEGGFIEYWVRTTAWASTRRSATRSSASSSACIGRKTIPAAASASRSRSSSSPAMAA
jgi:light-regulated signal transduction histidine kinase (bacteriophytochrome)